MSERVANLLSDWFRSKTYVQSNLDPNGSLSLSRIKTGGKTMTKAILTQVLDKLETDQQRADLLLAWLVDARPDTYAALVDIEKNPELDLAAHQARVAETRSGYRSLEDALEILQREAPGNLALSRVLVNLANLFEKGAP